MRTHTHTYRGTVRSNSASLIICRHHRLCVRRNDAHASPARGSRERANALLPS